MVVKYIIGLYCSCINYSMIVLWVVLIIVCWVYIILLNDIMGVNYIMGVCMVNIMVLIYYIYYII